MRTDIDERKDEIVSWLTDGVPQREVARRLECKIDTLKVRLKKWGVSHLKNQPGSGRSKEGSRVDVSIFLKKNGPAVGTYRLKNLLWRDGLKEKRCERCGITEWQGNEAPLELDHVDGNRYNNELDNLRILCPNCHALQPTNSGRNKGAYTSGSGEIW